MAGSGCQCKSCQRGRRPKTNRAVRYFGNKPPLPGVSRNGQEGKRGLAVGAGKWYRMGVMDTVRTVGMALERGHPAINDEMPLVAELQAGSEEAFAYLLAVYQ